MMRSACRAVTATGGSSSSGSAVDDAVAASVGCEMLRPSPTVHALSTTAVVMAAGRSAMRRTARRPFGRPMSVLVLTGR